eukprot:383210_1
MDKMKRCNFVIWHYEISVPILNESQSAFDLYFTSARWMANNLQFCLNNDALYQDILTEFMLPLLMDHVPFLRMSASNENTWFLPKVMFPVLSHLVFEGRYDTIDSILSRIMACDELEGDNCFLFALGNRFQDNGMQWLDGLNLNQSQTFLNIMLKYVGDTFNGTERRIIARNLYAIKSDSIPMGQLQGVDRDHFLEELIQLLKKYRFILNQDVYLAQIKSKQSISQIQKMRNIESKFGMWLCFFLLSGVLGFPPGILASLVAIFYYIGGELVNR